jgi:hypothetical protein
VGGGGIEKGSDGWEVVGEVGWDEVRRVEKGRKRRGRGGNELCK